MSRLLEKKVSVATVSEMRRRLRNGYRAWTCRFIGNVVGIIASWVVCSSVCRMTSSGRYPKYGCHFFASMIDAWVTIRYTFPVAGIEIGYNSVALYGLMVVAYLSSLYGTVIRWSSVVKAETDNCNDVSSCWSVGVCSVATLHIRRFS